MRDFAQIKTNFWLEEKRLIASYGGSINHIALMLYLRTCPLSNMIGVFYLPIEVAAKGLLSPFEGASKWIIELEEWGLISYDYDYEYVWVKTMALEQVGGKLKKEDNKAKGARKNYGELPMLRFLSDFYHMYKETFWLENERKADDSSKPLRSPFEAPSKQEIRNKKEEIRNKKEENNIQPAAASSSKNKKSKFSQKELEIGAEVVSFLVSTTKKNFGLIESHYEHIVKRVRQGVSVDDMKKVILFKSKQWLHLPSFSGNLNPATLFRDSKFDGYLLEANGEGGFFEKPEIVKEQELTLAQRNARNMLKIVEEMEDEESKQKVDNSADDFY